MKKALPILLALLFGLLAASPALAIDWTAQGAINVLSAFYKNMDERLPIYLGGPYGMNDFNNGKGAADPGWNRQNWWVQQRMQLYIIARASQDLYGTIGFEVDSTRWGDSDPSAALPGVGAHTIGRWNADAVAITVKSMFIDFKVPEVPVWFRVGLQPFIIRPWVMLCDDGAGVSSRVAIKAGDVKIAFNPFWAVQSKGGWAVVPAGPVAGSTIPGPSNMDWTTADDSNIFGVDANFTTGPVKLGGYFIYQARKQRYDTATGEGDSLQWWAGPYLDLKMGPLAATFDFVFNGGYEQNQGGFITIFERANPVQFTPPLPQAFSRRHQGWLTRGEASYTMNKLRVGMGFLYGTGDDPTTADRDEGFNVNFNGESAPVQRDFLIVGGDWGLVVPFGATTNIIGFYKPWSSYGQGIWHIRGFADYQVNSWLKLLVNGGYIGDTVRHGDEFGRDLNAAGVPQDDDSIGWEIDTAVQIKLYQNLTFSSAFGYLIGGKALSMAGGWRPQDPWAWINTLCFLF